MEKIAGLLIDSDILIDYLRGLEIARIFLLKANKSEALWISTISITEIYSGKETRDPLKSVTIELFLQNFHQITLTAEIAKSAGELRRDFGKPFADMMVAASAIKYAMPLVTRNSKHFRGISNLRVYKPY